MRKKRGLSLNVRTLCETGLPSASLSPSDVPARTETRDGFPLSSALPTLSSADLADFALLQTGVMFDVEYDLIGQRVLTPCYVPWEVIGTGVEGLARPRL